MKKLVQISVAFSAVLALAGLTGCRKDKVTFDPYENTLEAIGKVVFTQVQDPTAQAVYNFKNQSHDTTLLTDAGIWVELKNADNLFSDASGLPVACSTCDDLKIEVTLAADKRDLLGHELPATSGGDLLETGGMVHLRVHCKGKELQLLPGKKIKIKIPVGQQTDLKPDMKIFYAKEDFEGVTDWLSTGEEVFWAEWPVAAGSVFGYELSCEKTGWVGAARVVDAPSTPFCAQLDEEFNGQNTIAWLVIPDLRAVVPMDGFDKAGKFCFADAPLGYSVKLVTVSQINGQWLLGLTDTKIANDGSTSVAPKPSTEAEVVAFLQGL